MGIPNFEMDNKNRIWRVIYDIGKINFLLQYNLFPLPKIGDMT
jgi:hypothetical protein